MPSVTASKSPRPPTVLSARCARGFGAPTPLCVARPASSFWSCHSLTLSLLYPPQRHFVLQTSVMQDVHRGDYLYSQTPHFPPRSIESRVPVWPDRVGSSGQEPMS